MSKLQKSPLKQITSSQSILRAHERIAEINSIKNHRKTKSHPNSMRKKVLIGKPRLMQQYGRDSSLTSDFNTAAVTSSNETLSSEDTRGIDQSVSAIEECDEYLETPGMFYSVPDAQQLLLELAYSLAGNETLIVVQMMQSEKSTTIDSLKTLSEIGKNVCLLQAALSNRSKLLQDLILENCNLHFQDRNGLESIHLASLSGALESICILVSHDPSLLEVLDAKLQQYTPLHCAVMGNSVSAMECLVKVGASIEKSDGLLQCAVGANALLCVQYLLKYCNVDGLDSNGESALHIAADMGHTDILEELLKYGAAINQQTSGDKLTALHYSAEGGHTIFLQKLLSAGADPYIPNSRGQTALHFASRVQTVECMQSLLDTNMDPNIADQDGRTPLHISATPKCPNFDGIPVLLNKGARINEQDNFGYTALHLAALNELTKCVNILLDYGADFTLKNTAGSSCFSILVRKIPYCLSTIRDNMDKHLSVYDPESRESEVELKFDFHPFVPPGHRGEMDFFTTLLENGQKHFLNHPLCEAFLFLKWKKLQKFIYARLLSCLIFVAMITLYVITAFQVVYSQDHKNSTYIDKGNSTSIDMANSTESSINTTYSKTCQTEWYVLLIFSILHSIKEVYTIYVNQTWKGYISDLQHWLFWLMLVFIILMSPIFTANKIRPAHVCAGSLVVLIAWSYLMILVGRLPFSGIYVQMFRKVLLEFTKVLLIYMFLLIGFTVSFCILFNSSSDLFRNPGSGFVAVVAMMSGAFEPDSLLEESKFAGIQKREYGLFTIAHIVLLLFLLFVTMVLMNLMIGLAVSDIHSLKDAAQLQRLVQITEIVAFTEMAFLNPYINIFPSYVCKFLERNVLLSPASYRWVFYVNPHKLTENRLPKDIIDRAYNIVKYRKRKKQNPAFKSIKRPLSKHMLRRCSTWTVSDIAANNRSSEITNCKLHGMEHKIGLNNTNISLIETQLQELEQCLQENKILLKEILNIVSKGNSQEVCL